MTWLVIIFAIAVVVSPLMWFKQSPRQKRISQLRSAAANLNLQVSLHRRPEARESEAALTSVCYKIRCGEEPSDSDWVLHRFSGRGWASDWEGWQWFNKQADVSWCDLVEDIVKDMPGGVSAIIMQSNSVGMIWDERGDEEQLGQIAKKLMQLKLHAENKC
ncbi:hypothetical protein OAK26_05335 [Gammaproteobacteria bacterium]|nr:hypothetical protein [Gammaproteobacteria bacterium]